MQQHERLKRSVGKQKQGHRNPQQEEEAEARDHAGPQHRPPPVATSALAGRLDEASAAATQPEVEPVVALGEGCVVVAEGEELSKQHAGPRATRYTNDTPFDAPTSSSFPASEIQSHSAQEPVIAGQGEGRTLQHVQEQCSRINRCR